VLHIEDPVLAGADVFTLGSVLAEAVRLLEAGLVVAGDRSDEEGQGLVPAALAHHWGAPLLSRVQAVTLPAVDTIQVAVRSGGQLATLNCVPPLVLSISPAAELRELTMGASRAPESLPLARLGLDASRLVPRPDLLGALVPGTAEMAATMAWDELPSALLPHR
jgi:electron transfer flavoprotein alpha/beta subunit